MHCFFQTLRFFGSAQKTFCPKQIVRSLLRRCFLAEGSSRNGTFHPAAVAFCMLFCSDPSSSSYSSDAGALTNTPSQLQPAQSSLRAREHNQKKPDHRSTRERASEQERHQNKKERKDKARSGARPLRLRRSRIAWRTTRLLARTRSESCARAPADSSRSTL